MRVVEDPVQRQRALVEEDRHKYLGLEERVLAQLRYVLLFHVISDGYLHLLLVVYCEGFLLLS